MLEEEDGGSGKAIAARLLRLGVRPLLKRLLGVVRSARVGLRRGTRGNWSVARVFCATCLLVGVLMVLSTPTRVIFGAKQKGLKFEWDGRHQKWAMEKDEKFPGVAPTPGAKPLDAGEERDDAYWAAHDPYPDPERDQVGICYFIQIDAKSVGLLERLFSRLWHPDNVYVLHVDWKVDKDHFDYIEQLVMQNENYKKNFHFVEREAVTYKGISMVLNTISAMTLALQVSSEWEYFVNLSGSDYPLVSPTALRKLLARPRVPTGRLNFITLFPMKEWKPYSFRIMNQYWDPAVVGSKDYSARTRLIKGNKRWPLEWNRSFVFTKAEAWSIFSRRFVRFVVRSTFAKRMLLAHTHVLSAPEHYFADILYNHPFWRQTIVTDAFRKVVWWHKGRRSGQHPYVLDKGDHIFSYWIYLEKTRSIFARKVSIPNSRLMDRIDSELSGHGPKPKDVQQEREQRRNAEVFYRRLATHFDFLTRKTLKTQGAQWPHQAYPSTKDQITTTKKSA